MDEELWKDINGFDGKYQISSHGRCRYNGDKPLLRRGSDVILKPRVREANRRTDYKRISYSLSTGKSHKEYRAHILVAQAFIGERPDGYVIDHIDRNPLNNRLDNLRYVSPSQNNTNRTTYGAIEKSGGKFRSVFYINKNRYTKVFDTYQQAEDYNKMIQPHYDAIRKQICSHF
jgi:hypothetical protein